MIKKKYIFFYYYCKWANYSPLDMFWLVHTKCTFSYYIYWISRHSIYSNSCFQNPGCCRHFSDWQHLFIFENSMDSFLCTAGKIPHRHRRCRYQTVFGSCADNRRYEVAEYHAVNSISVNNARPSIADSGMCISLCLRVENMKGSDI